MSSETKNHWVGRKHTKESKEKMRLAHLGKKGPWAGKQRPKEEKSCRWTGDEVGYVGLHDWVRRKLGRPPQCKECGDFPKSPYQIHWANLSKKYKRDVNDWVRLCASCHKNYDNGKLKLTCI